MEHPIHPKAKEFYMQYMQNWADNPNQNLTAIIAATLSQKLNPDRFPNLDEATQNRELMLNLALRIRVAAAHASNGALTWLDMVNAICEWPHEFNLNHLLGLSDADFLNTVTYMVLSMRGVHSESLCLDSSSGAILAHLCV